ncbi:tetratricopeptide repeat protein, partial [Myxococcota bacterium]|nr:tetratricopeptide repeat protein [Myxococcota bacterium]
REILATLLVQQALGFVGGNPMEFRFLFETPPQVQAEKGKRAVELFRAARSLGPKSPVVFAAGAWIHYRMGLNKPAFKFSEILLSLSEGNEAKAFAGMFRLMAKDAKGAVSLFEHSSRPWLPLKILSGLIASGPKPVGPMVALLSDSDGVAGDYVRLFFAMTTKEEAGNLQAVALVERLLAKYPGKQWVLQPAFRLYLKTKKFQDARNLVPKIIADQKDKVKSTKYLMEQIEKLEKESALPKQPAANSPK